MIGDFVEIGVDANGMEGTDDLAGSNSRGGSCVGSYFGFVANPQMDGWTNYDGDFFTPGTPENGFGLDINGLEFGNNAASCFSPLYEITTTDPLTYDVIGDCIIVTWAGTAGGIGIKVTYKLIMTNTYYTTKVKMWNSGATTVPELYYYRNFDPDNNQPIGWGFSTNNTLVEQPDPACNKAIVSAEQSNIWDNYVGLGAIHPDIRVTYGGFTNRDGSDIWNGIGFTSTEGSSGTGDVAISLAYKITDFAPADTTEFEFAVILDESQVDAAINSLYFLDYDGGPGGTVSNECAPVVDTAITCSGYPITISVDGPDADAYDWTWDPPTGLSTTTGPTVEASPTSTTTYTVTGTSVLGCASETVTKDIVVELTAGPIAAYDDPGSQCGPFDINDLVWYDDASVPGTVSNFFTEIPDSADQTGPLFTGPLMDETDVVYLMIGDTTTGCFSVIEIDITFGGVGQAGNDSSATVCSNGDALDLDDWLSPWAEGGGVWDETTASGQFSAGTAVFDPTGLAPGIYTFTYTVLGVGPCPDDEATITVEVFEAPEADWSATGVGCITGDPVAFTDETTGGTPTDWDWDFDDGGSSATDPTHLYTSPGTYTVSLTVTTADGCVDTYEEDIIMYSNPVLSLTVAEPTCYALTDGSVTVNFSGGAGAYTITITDSDDIIKNTGGSNTANLLGEGWYYINVEDTAGCSGIDSVFVDDPDPLEILFDTQNPLCNGDLTGAAWVTDVLNVVGSNNIITYIWSTGLNGAGEDTLAGIGAGTYTIQITDENGCQAEEEFTITEPPALIFTEIGYDPAYCRLFPYQSGNGVVYAAAGGGTPDYTYLWTNLEDGDETDNTTWGGLNPGTYEIVVTDANGCILTQQIELDSLNPIAEFSMTSPQFEGDFYGTACMDIHFINESENFANPNNPFADTTFWWNFESPNGGWILSKDLNETFDTTYCVAGTYEICLVAQNKNGCVDTTCKELIVYDQITFEGVNVFTPNGDGINDVFTFINYAKSINTFHCVIVDRWGMTKAELNDITESWDGTDKSGSECVDGVYFYTWEAVSDNGTELQGQGTVQLLSGKGK